MEELGLIPSRDVPVAPGGAGICSVACGGPQAGAGGCSLKDVSRGKSQTVILCAANNMLLHPYFS